MRALLLALFFAAFAVACEQPAVEWADPVPVGEAAGATRLVVDAQGNARVVADTVHPSATPSAPGMCAASLQTAGSHDRFAAAWWAVRKDSSAALQVAASRDGGRTWSASVVMDTSDVSSSGCNRPPPALTTLGDDLFVAYSMSAPEGTGVFSAHIMSRMEHSPVAVIYGDRLVPVAIAADGNDVAVAYEEPNGTRPRIDVALSRTQGHIYESHLVASREVDDASAPAVALAGHTIAVSWMLKRPTDGAVSRVVRLGHLP